MCFVVSFRVDEYIASGRDKFTVVDPDQNQIHTKHKARECSFSLPGSASQNDKAPPVKYPTTGWGKALEKLPLSTNAEMKKHIEDSGKELEMLNTILFQQAFNVQRHFSKINISRKLKQLMIKIISILNANAITATRNMRHLIPYRQPFASYLGK